MKKFLVTILALVYLTTSVGATVHLHYCMGKLMSWDLSDKQKAKCGNCGMEKRGHKGCCKDEHKLIKVDKDYKFATISFDILKISTDTIFVTYVDLVYFYTSSLRAGNPTAHAPPRTVNVPIFTLYRNFRI